mgnify:CR=1 FL=1
MRTSVLTRVFVSLSMAGCSTGNADEPAPLEALFNGDAVVLDLTHPMSASMPAWANPNPFRHDTLSAHEDGAPSMAAYFTPEHHGTHLDAPVHGARGGASVDQLSAADLFGPAVVIDVRDQCAADPDYELTREDLLDWEARHGEVPAGAIVLMNSGWAAKWQDPQAYFNRDGEGRMHFPAFSVEAATFLVEERDIRGIGVDNPSVDPGAASGLPVHGIVNPAGKYHLENLADLSGLPASGAYLIVAPIKIEGGSGGQVRVFGVVP